MAPKPSHATSQHRNNGSLPTSPLVANFSGKSPGTGEAGERVCTYESMVEYYIEYFLQDVLKTALQSRGEYFVLLCFLRLFHAAIWNFNWDEISLCSQARAMLWQ